MEKKERKMAIFAVMLIVTSVLTTASVVSHEYENSFTVMDYNNHESLFTELGCTGLLPPNDTADRSAQPYDESDGGLVYIVIQDDLFGSISDSVLSLADNIENRRNTPYTVEIIDGIWNTHSEVRGILQDGYNEGLVGAILIGDIPPAWYYKDGFGPETFPIDLYYMDLDGEWGGGEGTESNPFTTHIDGTGDVEPEIWVGRLYTKSLSGLGSEEYLIDRYIEKVDDYSRGELSREEKALVFVDNDWYDWADQWDQDVGILYENRTFVKEYEDTNAPNYLNNLTKDYEWVSLFAHSNPELHVFYPEEGGSNTYAYNTDISGVDPNPLFYNLFCCSGAEYTYSSNGGYIAGHYLFSPSASGLVTVGSSKTGSMLQFQDFYTPLSQGAGIGEAFKHWHILNGQTGAGADSRDWFYGMNILGDPTLETGGYEWEDEPTTFDIPLDAGGEADGWNFVSFNLIPLETSFETIVEDISNNYNKAMYYHADDGDWYSYVPGRADHFNNLDTWDHTMGVWIRMTSSDILTVEGSEPTVTDITLYPGWNMVGLPSDTAGNHGLPAEVDKIGYFHASATYNLAYDYNPESFSFEPGKGYWIHNPTAGSLIWSIEYLGETDEEPVVTITYPANDWDTVSADGFLAEGTHEHSTWMSMSVYDYGEDEWVIYDDQFQVDGSTWDYWVPSDVLTAGNDIAISVLGYNADYGWGEQVDRFATVEDAGTTILFEEDFTGVSAGEIPAGWSRTHDNWGVSDTSRAGGAAPELEFYWSPSSEDTFMCYTPAIEYDDFASCERILVTFDHPENESRVISMRK